MGDHERGDGFGMMKYRVEGWESGKVEVGVGAGVRVGRLDKIRRGRLKQELVASSACNNMQYV